MWKDVKTQVIVGLASMAIVGAMGAAYDWFQGWVHLKYLWDGLFVTSPISRWFFWALVFSALITPVLVVLGALSAKPEPHETDFKSFSRFGMYWQWGWYNGQPWNIVGYCPSCLRMMRHSVDRYDRHAPVEFSCQHCRHVSITRQGNFEETERQIRIEIEHAVRTNTWKSETPIPQNRDS